MQLELDPTIARKKRKEILSHARQTAKRLKEEQDNATTIEAKSKNKYQNHYEPENPMSKEEAAEWRKQARRKRNRESAAASRNKVRNRIMELEDEVEEWKNKYSTVLKRIEYLEQAMLTNHSNRYVGNTFVQTGHQQCVSPCLSPTSCASNGYNSHLSRKDALVTLDLDLENSTSFDKLRVPLDIPFNTNESLKLHPSNRNGIVCNSKELPDDQESDPMNVATVHSHDACDVGGDDDGVGVVVSVPHEFHVIETTKSRPAE